jgi:hypothetical protein
MWNKKKLGVLLAFLIGTAAVVAGVIKFVPDDRLVVNINAQIVDEKGEAISGKVVVFELTENGPKKIYEGYAHGTATFSVAVKRELVTMYVENGKEMRIYKPVNLQIAVANKELKKLGVVNLAVDPTNEPHPVTLKSVKIVMRSVSEVKSEPVEGSWSTYKLTPVLSFAVWDDIQARYSYPVGSKLKIESKFRPWGSTTWVSNGYTEVELDRGVSSPYLNGEKNYTIHFNLKYKYAITEIEMDDYSFFYENIYAVDTNYDPQYYTRTSTGWDGHLPSGEYYITPAGDTTAIPITGGSNYAFTVSVGFSYPYGVSASLGVTKVPAPQATLVVTSTGSSGYVKTVGSDGFLKSYSNWL